MLDWYERSRRKAVAPPRVANQFKDTVKELGRLDLRRVSAGRLLVGVVVAAAVAGDAGHFGLRGAAVRRGYFVQYRTSGDFDGPYRVLSQCGQRDHRTHDS